MNWWVRIVATDGYGNRPPVEMSTSLPEHLLPFLLSGNTGVLVQGRDCRILRPVFDLTTHAMTLECEFFSDPSEQESLTG